MGEIEAAIGIEQLKKLNSVVSQRQESAHEFNSILSEIPGIEIPKISDGKTHAYYIYPMKFQGKVSAKDKFALAEELRINGVLGISTKYQNLHLLPMFQHKIAYGSHGFPWTLESEETNYSKGLCPVAEDMQDHTYLGFYMGGYALSKKSSRKISRKIAEVASEFNSRG
jgi:dTDP-4-amino-4,6-dideoxygalactose transaminase